MSNTFEFSYIVSGVDPHADNFEDVFFEAGCDDATIMLLKGSVVVTFAREHDTYSDAIVSAYADLLKTGVHIERFDPDFLVTASEIATRSNLTRQCITNYVKGERGDGFPAPIVRVLSPSPLWDWVDVSEWLYKNEQIEKSIAHDALLSRGVNMFIEQSAPMTELENGFYKKISEQAVMVA